MAEENEADESEVEDGEEGEDGKPKKSKKKLLLFVVLPVVILLLGGTAAALLLMGGKKEPEVALDEHGNPVAAEGEHGELAEHAGTHAPIFYAMPDIMVNISGDKEGEQLVLVIKMQLEVPDEETQHQLDVLLPRVVDRYQAFLRELRVEDIKGSAGNYRLRLELLRRVNLAVQPAYVNDVLIEKLLVN